MEKADGCQAYASFRKYCWVLPSTTKGYPTAPY